MIVYPSSFVFWKNYFPLMIILLLIIDNTFVPSSYAFPSSTSYYHSTYIPTTFQQGRQSNNFSLCPTCFGIISSQRNFVPRSSQQSQSQSQSLSTRTSTTSTKTSTTTTSLFGTLPENYQEYGEFIIRKVGKECGIGNGKENGNEDDLQIEWKTNKIVITLKTSENVYVSNPDDGTSTSASNDEKVVDVDIDDEEDTMVGEFPMDDEEDDAVTEDTAETTTKGFDMTEFARAINRALDDNGIGLAIAETHEIEVTTPGATDELVGQRMFEAYKGFDVICQHVDNKTKKVKRIEGRLVERNDEYTIVNIKGRMKKMKNETVLSVKLPKAKKEKGVK